MIATDRSRPSGARRRFRAGITDARAWLAAAGLVLYVLLRLAYSTFYQPLGVSPEELGFGYLDILAQAAVAFVVLVLVFGVAFLLLGVLLAVDVALAFQFVKVCWSLVQEVGSAVVGWFRHRGTPSDGDEAKSEGGSSESSSAEPSASGVSVGRSAGGALEPGAPAQSSPVKKEAGDGPQQRAAPRRMAVVGRWGAGWLSVVCVLIAAVLILQAASDRRAVERGEPRFPTAMGIRIASWGAHRATVTALAQNAPRELVALEALCLLYLGTHDGTVFLYDPQARETLRVPTAAVLVHIHQSGACVGLGR